MIAICCMLDIRTVTIFPWAAFAKAWGPAGLEVGHPIPFEPPGFHDDPDTADQRGELTYFGFRARLAAELRRGTGPRDIHEMLDYAVHAGGAPSELVASEWAERFMGDLRRHRARLTKQGRFVS